MDQSRDFDEVLGESESLPLWYRNKDGTWRTVRASACNLLDDPGVRAIVVLTRDVTEQIAAEERERRSVVGELHEDVQQILVGLRLHMEASLRQVPLLVPGESLGMWISHVNEVIVHVHALTQKLRARETSRPPPD
jgi:signal transduction histidine kinase